MRYDVIPTGAEAPQVVYDPHLIHASVHTIPQILGADRVLVVAAGTACALLTIGFGLWFIPISVALWIGVMFILQQFGKADPLLRQVYLRHIRYREFYPAKSGLHSRSPLLPMSWMIR